MHPSGDVNYQRAREVRQTGQKLLLALLLYFWVLLGCDFPELFIGAIAFPIGLICFSWAYFVLSGQVWEEWFWQPFRWRRPKP